MRGDRVTPDYITISGTTCLVRVEFEGHSQGAGPHLATWTQKISSDLSLELISILTTVSPSLS